MIPLKDNNPTTLIPVVNWVIMGLCILVFFWQLGLGPRGNQEAIYALGVIPAVLLEGARLPPEIARVSAEFTIFTSMFMHGGWLHLIGNMLYLWIFGDNVEDSMGHVRFIIFYLVCGTVAVFAQALPEPQSTIPMIGASGAISGVLGAYLLLYPHARVVVLVPFGFLTQVILLPAGVVLALWFGLQLVQSALSPKGAAGIAFGAHIGGFLAGMALVPFFKLRRVRLFNPPR